MARRSQWSGFCALRGEETQHGNAFWNDAECKSVETLIHNLLHAGVPAEDTGVITLYEGQRQHLRRTLDERIEVKTLTHSKDDRSRSL